MVIKQPVRLVVIILMLGALALGGWFFLLPVSLKQARQAAALALSDDNEAALERARNSLLAAGAPGEAQVLQGRMFLQRGQPGRALDMARKVGGADPAQADARVLAAECLLVLGRTLEAGDAFQEILKLQPDNADALLGMAAVWYDLGALVRALEPAEKAASLRVNDGRPLRLLGSIHLQLGERFVAREKLEQAVARQMPPSHARQALEQLLELELEEGRLSEATTLQARLAAFQAATAREQALAAWLMELQGDSAESLARLRAITEREIRDPTLWRWLGEALLRAGKATEAVAPLEKTVQLEPQAPEPRHLLARALDRAGQADKARQVRQDLALLEQRLKQLTALNAKVDENPLDPAPRLEMATVCETIGRPDWARQWRESAAKGRAGNP